MKYVYDLIIIGGGSAGLAAAHTASLFKKKVALVDISRLGGDCLWLGCIPSKTFIKAATYLHKHKELSTDQMYSLAKTRIAEVIKRIEEESGDAQNYREKGIDVIFGTASFVNDHTIKIDEKAYTSKNFLVSTGSRPFIPPIEGINEIKYYTNEEIFNLSTPPKSIIVVGGGPTGCEMAQALARIGIRTTIINRSDRLLSMDDEDSSALIESVFEEDRIYIENNSEVVKVFNENGNIIVESSKTSHKTEAVLIATGRKPNIDNVNLSNARVTFDEKKVPHNERMQTNRKNIYVAGDIAGDYMFTHTAAMQATYAVLNMFLPIPIKMKSKTVPWTTFTDPEVAHTGISEGELQEKKISYDKTHIAFNKIDRALTDNRTQGFIKLLSDKKGTVIGGEIVGSRAGEMIHEVTLAIENKLSLRKLAEMIHVYPTYSSGIQLTALNGIIDGSSSLSKIIRFLTKFT